MKNIDLNQLRDRAYQCALDHGFHEQELSNEHFLMLVITELSEAIEAERKGRRADKEAMIDTIEAGGWHWGFFEEFVKDTVEDELADAVIRLLDLAGLRGISLGLVQNWLEKGRDGIMSTFCTEETFSESAFRISMLPVRCEEVSDFPTMINDMILLIFGLAKSMGIDLIFYIEQKMKYNELREYKHNKKY